MPFAIEFRHPITPPDPAIYFNECCFGGDVVSEWLRPAVLEHYEHLQAEQEDWGWFLWFRQGNVRLAIDIFCDDPPTGSFRLFLTTREHRRFWTDRIVDTEELQALKELVTGQLAQHVGAGALSVSRLDANYDEVSS